VIPSDRNNIVGIKPTVGLTSRYLVVPVSEHQDTVGPMARTVEDAAKLLQIIAGVDPKDNYTSASPFKDRFPDYLAACKLSGLQGKRIGIARNVIDKSSDDVSHVMDAFEYAISVMANAGATIVENTTFTAFSQWKKREYNPVTRLDFVSNLAQYLSKLERNPKNIRSIEDLRDFTWKFPDEEYPSRNTRNWDTVIEQKINNTSPEFWPIYQENLYLGGEGGILGALERHSLDAVVLPTVVAASIPALVGTPIVTVPLGAASDATPVKKETFWDVVEMAPGIPFGISFLGAKWSEEILIEIAYAFEQRTLVRSNLKRHIEPRVNLADVITG
jgi:amidase